MSWSVEFAPQVPWIALWIAIGVAVLLGGVSLYRARPGAVLRTLVLAALVGALANPTLKQEDREPLSNVVVVVTDESASQRIDGRDFRANAIRSDLDAKLARFPGVETRWVSTGGGTNDQGTQLFSGLERALGNIPADRLAGIIFVTDGQIHDVPKSTDSFAAKVPVHALLTGEKNEFDRRIKILKAPRYGIVDSTADVEVSVAVTGSHDETRTPARLRIRREGKPDEVIAAIPERKLRIPFPLPHAGKNIIEIELEPREGELTELNNRVVIETEGVRENLRVLLVSGEPHAGERTWRNLLKSDAAVDLVHFTILRPPEKQDGTPIHQLSLIAFPTRELFSEKLHDFDLIIFDRYQRRGVLPILYLDNIARYVEEHGGAVLVAAGTDYADHFSLYRTPLNHVLPAAPTGRVIEKPYKAQITASGARHPVTRALPGASTTVPSWGRWFRLIEAQANSGQTLMQGPGDKPLLVLDRRGKGRVAILLSDHAWLWARGLEGGGPHTPLLRRLAHWLMKEPDLEEEFLSAKANGMLITIKRRTMKEEVLPVTVTAPSGEAEEVILEKSGPGRWKGSVRVEQPGLYNLRSGELTAIVHAGAPNSREMTEVIATDERLAPILQATGGGAFWTKSGSLVDKNSVDMPRLSMLRTATVMHGNGWLGLRDRDAYVTRGVKLIPLYAGFAALALLLALLAVTWWREGR